MPPVPAEPQVILPGFALAASIKPLKSVMPVLLFTTRISWTRTMSVIGAMSLAGS